MKILLLGEYSNVHRTLRDALRRQGHEVLLCSDGDGWKDYPRDIDLRRTDMSPMGGLRYLGRIARLLPRWRGYDVVHVVNPDVFTLRAHWNRRLLHLLQRHNRLLSLGCYGDDYTVVSRMQDDSYLSYTDFYAAGRPIEHPNNAERTAEWTVLKRALCEDITARADCLTACLYEYWKVYDTPEHRDRLHYVPLPIPVASAELIAPLASPAPDAPGTRVRILVGIQTRRTAVKGTDQMLPLLERLAAAHPDRIELEKVENVPFAEYRRLMMHADVLVDQLYSFTPAMNALEAMSHGLVVISGGEEEFYDFIGERELRPIINLRPFDDEANYRTLEASLPDLAHVRRLQRESLAFIRRHHDADAVAEAYVRIWEDALRRKER